MTFLWDITRGAHEFTPKETRIMRWFLDTLIEECPKTCSFLTVLELDKIKFFWSPNMTYSNGILGAWCVTSPNHIYIRSQKSTTMCDVPNHNRFKSGIIKDMSTYLTTSDILETTVGTTVIHEFIHKLQFHTSPILYVLNRFITLFVDRIPFLEQLGIEYDARVNSETDELQDFLGEFYSSVSSYFSAILSKSPDDPDNWLYKCWAGIDGYDSCHSNKIKKLTIEYFNLINEDM